MIQKSPANRIEQQLVKLMIVCEHTKRSTHGLLPTITEKPKRTCKFQDKTIKYIQTLSYVSCKRDGKTELEPRAKLSIS